MTIKSVDKLVVREVDEWVHEVYLEGCEHCKEDPDIELAGSITRLAGGHSLKHFFLPSGTSVEYYKWQAQGFKTHEEAVSLLHGIVGDHAEVITGPEVVCYKEAVSSDLGFHLVQEA